MSFQLVTPHPATIPLPDRMLVLENLSVLREEWEAAAAGDSLMNVSASVGLIMFDITTQLGLTPEEQAVVLGSRLYSETFVKYQGESTR